MSDLETEVESPSEVADVPTGRTLGELIDIYQTDKVSGFHKLRYHVRENQRSLMRRMTLKHGHTVLSTIKRRTFLEWHMEWSDDGQKASSGHAFIAKMRTLCSFGADDLEDEQCLRLCMVLHRMKFAHAEPRTAFLSVDQANLIRDVACSHFGWSSIAFAQAIQFELLLRQKDVIGEWVPQSEPGESYVYHDGKKWLRGLLWEEIDDNLILKHRTSKRQKMLEVDLKLAPMVIEEFRMLVGTPDGDLHRSSLPTSGPVIICDINGLPWTANEYRRKWRLVANKAGIPKDVRNMDSRAGGITEASRSGVSTEYIKHAATHSDIAQTQRYSRDGVEKIAETQKARIKNRIKSV